MTDDEQPDQETFSQETVQCPVCRDRLVLQGALCFDCERKAANEAANDIGLIEAFLAPHRAFTDFLIQKGIWP